MKNILIAGLLILFYESTFGQTKLENEIIATFIKVNFKPRINDTIVNANGEKEIIPYKKFDLILLNKTISGVSTLIVYSLSSYQQKGLKSLDKEIIEDFNKNNFKAISIDKIRGLDAKITYLSKSTFKNIITYKSWNYLYINYDFSLIIGLSRPGLNKTKDKAIILCNTPTEFGDWNLFFILNKNNNEWIIKESILISHPDNYKENH